MTDVAGTEATRLVDEARTVRGVVAAAVVSVDGEVLAAAGEDASLLERMQATATSALAAAEAFSDLLDDGAPEGGHQHDPEAEADAEEAEAPTTEDQTLNVTVLYQEGFPLLFTPLAGGERLMVVAVESAGDIGRARFQLRRLAQR